MEQAVLFSAFFLFLSIFITTENLFSYYLPLDILGASDRSILKS